MQFNVYAKCNFEILIYTPGLPAKAKLGKEDLKGKNLIFL
jgi:hypothetical protein